MGKVSQLLQRIRDTRASLEKLIEGKSYVSETFYELRLSKLGREIDQLDTQVTNVLKEPISVVTFYFWTDKLTGYNYNNLEAVKKVVGIMIIPSHDDIEIEFCIDRDAEEKYKKMGRDINKIFSSQIITNL
jgi:hypothetical protein